MEDIKPIVPSQPVEYQPPPQASAYQPQPPLSEYQQTHAGYDQGRVITLQPQQQLGTAPGKILIPMTGNRDWSSGICDCTQDITNCLLVAFCGPCMQSSAASRMGENACVPCCVPGAMIALRQRLRTLGGIQGTLCNDCLTFYCCGPCALCQMKREMDVMGIV